MDSSTLAFVSHYLSSFLCGDLSFSDCVIMSRGMAVGLLLILLISVLSTNAKAGFSLLHRWRVKSSSFSSIRFKSRPTEEEEAAQQTKTTTTATISNPKNISSLSDSIRKSLPNPLQWWQEMVPTFLHEFDQVDPQYYEAEDSSFHENNEWIPHSMIHSTDSNQQEQQQPPAPLYIAPDVTHFCFLVHGHRGFSRDLSYLQTVMRKVAAREKKRRWMAQQEQEKDENTNESGTSAKNLVHDLVVHSVTCNEKRTDDGVANGGQRVVDEILQVIRSEMEKRKRLAPLMDENVDETTKCSEMQNVTISLVGNSLGGIYSRYAIAKLVEKCERDEENRCLILDDRYRLFFNIFCTTATPHLGLSSHTFLPLPRSAEIGVAHALGDTGRDLFRLNDLMKEMSLSPGFLDPLRRFRHRIAYANAFGTDFPVPTQTAAFLSASSTYPHHFVEDSHNEDRVVVDDNGLVIATLHTPVEESSCASEEECYLDDEENDELVAMSRSLDSLGWKKVFVDVRKEIPKIFLPTSLLRRNTSSNGNSTDSDSEGENNSNDNGTEQVETLDRLKEKGVASSADVAAALSGSFREGNIHVPMGHNMIVAFSRGRLSSYMNKAGRPLVDSLAAQLVDSIFSWTNTVEKPAEAKVSQS